MIVVMTILPPNVEVLVLFLVIPASLMPGWTIVLTIILLPNVEVLVLVMVVPTCMPE